ncbi:hypothetical protein BD310DRAFT_982955 [Dichomitus squalens]|uniref:Uncharacterized protein n=1 Tax=Dichomitus squalens TaxID=114155 RepID=A0A4Q9PCW9_9APHY|nr:hypothetical protein BD310DRAFT_982955 [Dichomitus squalens]
MAGGLPLGRPLQGQFATAETKLRSELRQLFNAELARLSGVSNAKMRWTLDTYLDYVFFPLGLKLEGWPPTLRFANLSNQPGIRRLRRIKFLWEMGVIHFAPVTDADRRRALRNRFSVAPGPLNYSIRESYSRSDIKARRYRPKTNPFNRPYRFARKGPKSAKVVSAEAEAAAEVEVMEARERQAAAEEDFDDIEQFSDDEMRHEAQELSSDPIEEWE